MVRILYTCCHAMLGMEISRKSLRMHWGKELVFKLRMDIFGLIKMVKLIWAIWMKMETINQILIKNLKVL